MPDPVQIFFDSVLPNKLPRPESYEAYSPSNIALAKYWGKRDQTLNLPLNSSLSISLGHLGSKTHVSSATDGVDGVWFDGDKLPNQSRFAQKVLAFADLFRRGQNLPLHIVTKNTIPTASGLASSASGFAALTRAISGAFKLALSDAQLSMISRFGSGSASRSIWHGFVCWDRGVRDDGTDCVARQLPHHWPGFRIAVIPVDTDLKSVPSSDGMRHTVATSPLFEAWPEHAEADCIRVEAAVLARDFTVLGETVEANALAMHATMLASRPVLNYLQPASWTCLETIWNARKAGIEAYATMDAGANIKVLFLETNRTQIETLFPQGLIIDPFADHTQECEFSK
ncbi:diphosphomevalonate decarboxylase [Rhodobacteraceae bacterium KLH11]|nr:diphosphomevalonate decarboxylase [Rhodobacteraceae bacterium KLH11]